jgi:hypothetical protein
LGPSKNKFFDSLNVHPSSPRGYFTFLVAVAHGVPAHTSAAIRPNGTFTTLKRALTLKPAFCLLMPSQLGSFTLDEKINLCMSSVKMSMVLEK